jgi:hypothetical protein
MDTREVSKQQRFGLSLKLGYHTNTRSQSMPIS